jgi:hypothetical protein
MDAKYGDGKRLCHMSTGEQQEISIEDVEIEDLRLKGAKCLVGRLGVIKKFNKESFKTVLLHIWRVEGKLFFKEILPNIWLFEFSDLSDKQWVLNGRPWSYDRTILVVNDFNEKIPPSKMDFSFSPLWIQFHDMPLGCMNRGIGAKIRGSIGKIEEIVVAANDVGWGRYLRVRVAINLFNPLDRGRSLNLAGTAWWSISNMRSSQTFATSVVVFSMGARVAR